MYIQNLVEDTNKNTKANTKESLQREHGLSFYVRTKKHKLLFDLGASDLFSKNAKILDINLKEIDTVIISHGHYDHGGGISSFLKLNQHATIYIREEAFGNFYSKRTEGYVEIGLDPKLKYHPQIKLVKGNLKIDDELFLYGNINERKLWSKSNCYLKMRNENEKEYQQDIFLHEQNLVISEKNRKILLCGCGHNGIVNIMEQFEKFYKSYPDTVIGGFHLINPRKEGEINEKMISDIATYLLEKDSKYYTCHCTGEKGYEFLKVILHKKIDYISTGDICINDGDFNQS